MIFNTLVFQNTETLLTEKKLSIIELINNGGIGGQLIIGLLFLLFLVSIYIYFERIFAIRSAVKVSPDFMNQIRTYVLNGKIEGAQQHCMNENIELHNC